jgi:DDE superfamily endonuclease
MRIATTLKDKRTTQAVLGLSRAEFNALPCDFERCRKQIQRAKPNRRRAPGGGRKTKLGGPEGLLFFILFYLKALDRSECQRWVKKLLPVLEETLRQKLVLPRRKLRSLAEFAAAFPGASEVMIDGTERRIQRPSRPSTNRQHYTGKKKAHTRKTLVMTDRRRRIGVLTRSQRGRRHDKKLSDREDLLRHVPEQVSVLTDSGLQGVRHPGLCLPSKGSKKRPLSPEQREWNGLVSSLRIGVEHAIAGMKRYGAAAQIYRNHLPRWDDHFNLLSAGLWNHHLEFQAAN